MDHELPLSPIRLRGFPASSPPPDSPAKASGDVTGDSASMSAPTEGGSADDPSLPTEASGFDVASFDAGAFDAAVARNDIPIRNSNSIPPMFGSGG